MIYMLVTRDYSAYKITIEQNLGCSIKNDCLYSASCILSTGYSFIFMATLRDMYHYYHAHEENETWHLPQVSQLVSSNAGIQTQAIGLQNSSSSPPCHMISKEKFALNKREDPEKNLWVFLFCRQLSPDRDKVRQGFSQKAELHKLILVNTELAQDFASIF